MEPSQQENGRPRPRERAVRMVLGHADAHTLQWVDREQAEMHGRSVAALSARGRARPRGAAAV